MQCRRPRDPQEWVLVELFFALDGWRQVYAAGAETVIVSPETVERVAAPWPGVCREVDAGLGPAVALHRARACGFGAALTTAAVRFLTAEAPHASYVLAFDDGRWASVDPVSGAVHELR
jgi:hypothetical protein